jgi:membrane peptidoglycan carboxypeptidase
LFAALHFSEQDRLTIIARLAPTGGGRYGLDNTSEALFGRPLSDLSLSEAGTIVVLTKTPFLYDKPDRLIAARDQFLSRYQ